MAGRVQLKVGDRIYYSGDMANSDGFGTVTRTHSNATWGDSVDVAFDDGRESRGLHIVQFSPTYSGNGSTRFVTEAAYQDWRQARIAEMQQAMLGA